MPHETSIVGLFCPAQAPSYSFLAMFHSRFRNCSHLCEYITSDHPDHYYHFKRIQPFLGVDFAKDFYQEPAKCRKKDRFRWYFGRRIYQRFVRLCISQQSYEHALPSIQSPIPYQPYTSATVAVGDAVEIEGVVGAIHS